MNKFIHGLINFIANLVCLAISTAIFTAYYLVLTILVLMMLGGINIFIQIIGFAGLVYGLYNILKLDRLVGRLLSVVHSSVREYLYRAFAFFNLAT